MVFVRADERGSEVGHIHSFRVDGNGLAVECTPGLGVSVVRGMGHDFPVPLLARVADDIAAHCRAAAS